MTRDRDRAALEAKDLTTEAKYRIELDRVRKALVLVPGISEATRQTGLLMTWFTNQSEFRETGQLRCWPSVETLATELCLTPRAIEQGRKRLIEVGALEVVKKGGRGPRDPSIYALSLDWADNELNELKDRLSDAREAKRANRHSPLDCADKEAVRANAGAVKGERQSEKGRTVASIRANQRSPDSYEDSLDNNLVNYTHDVSDVAFGEEDAFKGSREAIAEAPITEATDLTEEDLEFLASFDAFWISFPRETLTKIEHMRRADSAAKAYRRALKRGASHDRILAGAARYAHACRKQPHRHAMTEREWLDGRHWIAGE